MKVYITFGFGHMHVIGTKVLDKDTVAVIECHDYHTGRERAFELFGPKFCTCDADSSWTAEKSAFYPKGVVEV